ncbi:MAG: hypothetical protein JXR73_08405 [Candidatus Omnitrophica bacterium]|nr:hypothetical protein [Candidatus Omnitrophota bacterium]
MRSVLLIILFFFMGTALWAAEGWEMETQMAPGGKLDLKTKSWWSLVDELKVGEHFVSTSSFPDGGAMIVRRDARTRSRSPQDMLVWIIDDDGDMPPGSSQGDRDSDCYVVDYGCDGTVDRILDYIDVDRDQIPDEMDIRYFVDGELRRAWFGVDLDGDGEMWHTIDYEYTGDFFLSDPYGNNEIYMNKYNPQTDSWIPISECPFTFYDDDRDGLSESVVRFSAAPLDFSSEADPDYANSQKRYEGTFDSSMNRMGVVNIRYSLDMDEMSDGRNPLHYEMGFNMVGRLPYDFERMERTQDLRRAPKSTVCIPFEEARRIAEQYPADHTGFSWHEFEDPAIRIGGPRRPEYDRRWEGVFWTWERRIMHNTGGPVQLWNMRREYMPSFSDRRQLYYSPIDRRLHLKGAAEGWIRARLAGLEQALGEIRMFDVNQDGYFDRWEYYWKDDSRPYRIASGLSASHRDFEDDWDAMKKFYNEQVLPQSIQLNQQVIRALEELDDDSTPIPDFLREALEGDISPDERRYVLDWIREYRWRNFISKERNESQRRINAAPKQDPRSESALRIQSEQTWDYAMQLSLLEEAYARGDYELVLEHLEKIHNRE